MWHYRLCRFDCFGFPFCCHHSTRAENLSVNSLIGVILNWIKLTSETHQFQWRQPYILPPSETSESFHERLNLSHKSPAHTRANTQIYQQKCKDAKTSATSICLKCYFKDFCPEVPQLIPWLPGPSSSQFQTGRPRMEAGTEGFLMCCTKKHRILNVGVCFFFYHYCFYTHISSYHLDFLNSMRFME